MIANGARALIIRVLDNIGLVQDLNHEGEVILDKLISDIKSRIPGKKKQDEDLDGEDTSLEVDGASDLTDSDFKADKTGVTQIGDMDLDDEEDLDDGDEEEEEAAPVSILDKIKALLKKKKAPAKKTASGKADKAPQKKSFISKPIAAVLLIGVVAFLFGDQIFPPEPEIPAVDPELAAFEKKKKDKAAAKAKEAEAAAAGTTDATATDTATTDITATDAATTEPVTEPTLPGEAPTEDVTSTTEKLPTDTSAVDAATPMVDITPPTDETTLPTDTTVTETPTTETPGETVPETETPMVTSPSETSQDTIDSDATAVTEENMTDKILEDLEKQVKQTTPRPQVTTYIAPPDYEYRGRGLVYNCVGKHWACIDGPSYRVCEDNAAGTKFLNKKNECYPFNVYQTQVGCEKTQNRMVSSGAKTKFCNE